MMGACGSRKDSWFNQKSGFQAVYQYLRSFAEQSGYRLRLTTLILRMPNTLPTAISHARLMKSQLRK